MNSSLPPQKLTTSPGKMPPSPGCMQATGIFGTAVGTLCFLLIILIWYLEIKYFPPFDGPSSNNQFLWNNIVMPLLAFLLSAPLAAIGACLWFVGFLGGTSVFKDPTSSRDDKRLAAVTAGVPGVGVASVIIVVSVTSFWRELLGLALVAAIAYYLYQMRHRNRQADSRD